MSLSVTDLTITVAGRTVVDSVSFAVDDGGRIGIIGESGSGKSMTALAVLGLLPDGATATGSIRLDGRELLGRPDRELARVRGSRIAMVFQEPRTALNPIRTIGRQIMEPVRIHERLGRAECRARALELAKLVALNDPEAMLSRYPHQLSGGQRQRVGIAMALAARPQVLIADEPTTALDVTIQAEILELFERVVTQLGTSLVFITHDLAVLQSIVETAIVLDNGRLTESGSVHDLLAHPTSAVTRRIVDAARATSWTRPEAT
ncbi:ATP-binding cassette domain-containing protein [Paramicrobacterium agarici]|uniref:ATP-binding cassette domain-containing protein n=1 Tax=Paramicrobacterium agarici TaxID=630514 RepID=UPI00114ED3A2|nr:ABC transporter ATP-binding protein [Microbacterium agarici]TQO23961.1 peptide/nickel transport system ATP-binding protein [Microbacterium agarici]